MEAKQVIMSAEPNVHALINELKACIEKVKEDSVEKPMCVKQAAEYLGIHTNTIYKRIKNGDLPAQLIHRMNGSVYFFASELRDYIKRS